MKKVILDRYNYYKTLSVDERREWYTLFIIYPFAAIMLSLYYLKYNFLYKVSEYNIYFYSLAILMFIIISLGLLSKNKNFAFLTYLFSLTLAVFFMIFVSGGVKAPGLSWLTLFGPVFGLFYGKKGILFGIFCSMLLFVCFFYLDKFGLNPNVILQHANYQHEKNSNFFTFLIFMGSNFLAYAIAYEKASRDLKEKNEQIELFLRVLFHDVANPLSVILMSSDSMLQKNLYTEDGVRRIKKSASSLREQLETVKKLKAIKDGKYQLEINSFPIKTLIDTSIDMFSERCNLKGIKIVVNLLDVDQTVKVDRVVFVNQIISNILSNSIKFSHPNSEILFRVQSTSSMVSIEIKDSGIGMSEDLCKHLFKVDKVKSRSGTNDEVGSGYGLSIAKYFTESFGGTISVYSLAQSPNSTDHGTVFTLTFPKN